MGEQLFASLSLLCDEAIGQLTGKRLGVIRMFVFIRLHTSLNFRGATFYSARKKLIQHLCRVFLISAQFWFRFPPCVQ